MKKTLILAASLLGAISGYSQGTVVFQDGQSDMTIHIFAPQTATPGTELTGDQAGVGGASADIYYNNGTDGNYAGGATSNTGNTGTASSGGSAAYTGGALGGSATAAGAYLYNNGNDYSVELFAAPGLNAPVSALQPVTQYVTTIATTTAKTGQFKTISPPGDTGIPSTPAGTATIALVAWYNGAGTATTYTSYAAALAAGVPTGISLPDNDSALGGIGGPPASTPIDMQGLESFSLVAAPVPEPSTIALGVIGASTLLFRRRKK
jgi:hypothetical protein